MNRFGVCNASLLLLLLAVHTSLEAKNGAALNAITRFPYQDTTRSVSEAFPLTLSDQTVIFVWAETTAIRYSKSTDGGATWNAPSIVRDSLINPLTLTGIRTMSGRLIVAWYNNPGVRYTISDDNGVTWSSPASVVGAGGAFLQFSQTSDGKIWLAWRSSIGGGVGGRYVTSTDNGNTWGSTQSLSNTPGRNDLFFLSGQGGVVHCIYSTQSAQSNIERITSTNGGVTWSTAVPILNTDVPEKRPRIAKQSDGDIWLLYEFTRNDTMPVVYQTMDVNYVVSTDSGTTWSSPTPFTRFVGNDYKHNVAMLNDAPFVTFASSRWAAGDRLWYGIVGVTPDDNPPPIFFSGSQLHFYSDLENWIRASVDDEEGIASVAASYSVDSISYPPVQLFDDGLHWDDQPGDNTWGGSVASFPNGLLECRFVISDIGGNTLNDVYGFNSPSYFPPSTTHVTQGSSMRVAFNRLATFGKHVLPSATYPSYGLRYPDIPFEHVYGAGIWVGGKIDTTASGTGERIKAVSTGYDGYFAPLNEFLPRSQSDSIWMVYGRNATKPSGWDQYWGSALQFHPFGDENFYNQYDDYTNPVNLRSMKLNIIQSSYTWNDPQGEGIQILEFRVMNNSTRTIDSAYVAFFMDADVGPIEQPDYKLRNCSGFLPASRVAYTMNPVDFGSTPVGVSVLNADEPLDSLRFTFQWYPAPQSPNSDALKYDLMSSGVVKPDEYPAGSDTRFLVSFGPFAIQPYTAINPDTLRVAFALLSATDLNQLQVHANRAYDIYQTILGEAALLNVNLAAGWNLISNPVTNPIPGDSVRQLYPTSFNPYAFEFSGGYVHSFRMLNGKGYWEKFPSATSNAIIGTPRLSDSISVVAGWNIIGSISDPVDTSTIVSIPPGLRVSKWFGYSAGYNPVTQLIPGQGYWVKSSSSGKFILASQLTTKSALARSSGVEALDVLNCLTITDSRGGSQTLYFGADANNDIQSDMYAMPPTPPQSAFDARFDTPDGGSMVQTHGVEVSEAVEFTVAIQSDAYPVTFSWKIKNSSYALTDGQGSKVFSPKEMIGEGSLRILNSSINKVSVKLTGSTLLPKEFSLSQNYPNPFNPSTTIKYNLPKGSHVSLKLFNILGQEVATLVNEEQKAGYKSIEWNAANVASGVYMYQLKSANYVSTKKALLLR